MTIDEETFVRLPEHLKDLFVKQPNPAKDEVLAAFAAFGTSKSPATYARATAGEDAFKNTYSGGRPRPETQLGFGDSGTPARFFYSAKASKADRCNSKHPTVKPVSLMRYLCRLACPPGGVVLDPFAGSGTTLQAAVEEGFSAIGIEREREYLADIKRRMKKVRAPEPQKKAA
jgi:site-specific DNA-methyltransferase (adenine-specific)